MGIRLFVENPARRLPTVLPFHSSGIDGGKRARASNESISKSPVDSEQGHLGGLA